MCKVIIKMMVIVILVLINTAVLADDTIDLVNERPNKDGHPTEVKVGVAIINLVKINEVEESFRVDFVVSKSWHDPRLATPSLGNEIRHVNLDEIWSPDIDIINARNVQLKWTNVSVDKEGHVVSGTRYFGNMSDPLNLRDFPFDEQDLKITLYTSMDETGVVIRGNPDKTGFMEENILSGWSVSEVDHEENASYKQVVGSVGVHVLDFTIRAQRLPGYYIWKLFLPLALIVMMAWLVFWIDPNNFGPQLGLTTGAVFALTAFLIGLGKDLPQINYLTKADIFIVGCMFLVFGALAEAVGVSHLSMSGRNALAIKIDAYARWIYPALFLAIALLITMTAMF